MDWQSVSPIMKGQNWNCTCCARCGYQQLAWCAKKNPQNNYGQAVQVQSLVRDFVPKVVEGEAIAALEAIRWLKELNLKQVIIEVDYQSVAYSIASANIELTEFGSIIRCCRDHLIAEPSYRAWFVRRQANLVAHGLDRASRDYASPQDFYHLPNCIAELCSHDLIIWACFLKKNCFNFLKVKYFRNYSLFSMSMMKINPTDLSFFPKVCKK